MGFASVMTGTTRIRINAVDALINSVNLAIQVEVGALAVWRVHQVILLHVTAIQAIIRRTSVAIDVPI
jgi:hypothetical protein